MDKDLEIVLQDRKHPMLQLLELTGLEMMVQRVNFAFFLKLKRALEKDSKETKDLQSNPRAFDKIIDDTTELFQNQGSVLNTMIAEWTLSVLHPLVESLNDYGNGDSSLELVDEGYLLETNVSFVGGDNWANDFVASVDVGHLQNIKDILTEWENTLAVIDNSDELIKAIDSALTQ